VKNYLSSVTHSKHSDFESSFNITESTRLIYNEKHQKLYADFCFCKNFDYVAVLYVGYGISNGLTDALKKYYLDSGCSVVIICASGYMISGGNKKSDDLQLSEDLSDWLSVIKSTFGEKVKILLHGFSYTGLAVLNCSDNCFAVFSDNTHLFPTYNYRVIKNSLIKKIYKNKSRAAVPGIKVPVFLSSERNLSKETYKLYEHSCSKKSVFIYDKFSIDEYIARIDKFIRHLKPPEE